MGFEMPKPEQGGSTMEKTPIEKLSASELLSEYRQAISRHEPDSERVVGMHNRIAKYAGVDKIREYRNLCARRKDQTEEERQQFDSLHREILDQLLAGTGELNEK